METIAAVDEFYANIYAIKVNYMDHIRWLLTVLYNVLLLYLNQTYIYIYTGYLYQLETAPFADIEYI